MYEVVPAQKAAATVCVCYPYFSLGKQSQHMSPSPFVLVFVYESISVLFLVRKWVPTLEQNQFVRILGALLLSDDTTLQQRSLTAARLRDITGE